MIVGGGEPRADSIKIYSYVISVHKWYARLPGAPAIGETRPSSATFTSSFFIVITTGEGPGRNLYFAPAAESAAAAKILFLI